MPKADAVVQGFKHALQSGDVAKARSLLSDSLAFRGPIDTFDAPEPYLQSLQKLSHIVDRIDMKKTFVDGDDVCMIYDMVTKTPAGTATIAEWHHVEHGKITAIRVIFDARPFAAMFGK